MARAKKKKKEWLEQSQKIRWANQGHLGPIVVISGAKSKNNLRGYVAF